MSLTEKQKQEIKEMRSRIATLRELIKRAGGKTEVRTIIGELLNIAGFDDVSFVEEKEYSPSEERDSYDNMTGRVITIKAFKEYGKEKAAQGKEEALGQSIDNKSAGNPSVSEAGGEPKGPGVSIPLPLIVTSNTKNEAVSDPG